MYIVHTYFGLISIHSHKFALLIQAVTLVPHLTLLQQMFIFIFIFILNKCFLCMMRVAILYSGVMVKRMKVNDMIAIRLFGNKSC